MVDWHYKHMDTLTVISRHLADDASLPISARESFLRSYYLASTLKHFNLSESRGNLERAFTSLCDACKNARLHQCDPSEASFHSCRLVVAHHAS